MQATYMFIILSYKQIKDKVSNLIQSKMGLVIAQPGIVSVSQLKCWVCNQQPHSP